MTIWTIWLATVAATFLVLEAYALITGEKKLPTLSRYTWRQWASAPVLRWVLLGFMLWATAHLVGGECFAGVCIR